MPTTSRPVRPPARARTWGALDGPPLPLPAVLDRCSEAWWRARPRTRAALLALLLLASAVATSVRAVASPWGTPTSVLVATRDLEPGTTLQAADLRRQQWPAELVPVAAVDTPAGRLVAPLPEGAALTGRHLGQGGVTASLPPGTAAVILPADLLPALDVGARIDLVGADLDLRGVVLAAGALVLHDDGTSVWVAVPHERSADVAAAATAGAIAAVALPP